MNETIKKFKKIISDYTKRGYLGFKLYYRKEYSVKDLKTYYIIMMDFRSKRKWKYVSHMEDSLMDLSGISLVELSQTPIEPILNAAIAVGIFTLIALIVIWNSTR